jgi:glycosyltransferase involved in cell wall biosynthesis
MSAVNVLWVIDHVCYDGSLHGGGRLYWDLLPRFKADRVHVVACMLRATTEIRALFARSPFSVRILDKAKFDPTTLWTFLRLIKEENVHAMHLHCYASSTFGRLAGVLTGVPTIIHDYDTEVYFPYPSYLGLADRLLAATTAGALAASPMVRDFLLHRRGIPREKIRLMLHAIPRAKYVPIPEDRTDSVRGTLGIDKTTHVVGTVTKLGPQRGNRDLLRALQHVVDRCPNTVLLLIHKQPRLHRPPSAAYVQPSTTEREDSVSDLQLLARQLGIEGHIRFVPWPENVDVIVAVSDVIVAPFRSERFSSVQLLEAMAQGKPLIATDMGEPREIIRNGVNGYLVAPGDVQELAARILELLTDSRKLQEVGHEARSSAEQHSVDVYAERLQRWYTELAAGQPARPRTRRLGTKGVG